MPRPELEQEESSGTYGAISGMAEQASDYASRGASEVQECIREHSVTSIAISLAAGFGIGFLIGRALGMPHPEPRSRRYRMAAEGMGHRLMERIEAVLPNAIAERFGK